MNNVIIKLVCPVTEKKFPITKREDEIVLPDEALFYLELENFSPMTVECQIRVCGFLTDADAHGGGIHLKSRQPVVASYWTLSDGRLWQFRAGMIPTAFHQTIASRRFTNAELNQIVIDIIAPDFMNGGRPACTRRIVRIKTESEKAMEEEHAA